jgi:hypothetical protein
LNIGTASNIHCHHESVPAWSWVAAGDATHSVRGGETDRDELRHSNPLCAALHQVLRPMVSWCHEDQQLNSFVS